MPKINIIHFVHSTFDSDNVEWIFRDATGQLVRFTNNAHFGLATEQIDEQPKYAHLKRNANARIGYSVLIDIAKNINPFHFIYSTPHELVEWAKDIFHLEELAEEAEQNSLRQVDWHHDAWLADFPADIEPLQEDNAWHKDWNDWINEPIFDPTDDELLEDSLTDELYND